MSNTATQTQRRKPYVFHEHQARDPENIREKYPPGTAVEVVEFHDQYRDIPAGAKGRVLAVDDTGTIHCEFENGVSLGALWGIDIVKKID